VKLVGWLGIVCKLQSTEGASAAHLMTLVLSQVKISRSSWVRMRDFRPCSIIPFARLTCPFVQGLSNCCPVYPDVVVFTEVQELLSGELSVIVSDDRVGDCKVEDNVLYKAYRLFGANCVHGISFDPLTELVDYDKQVGEVPGHFLKGPKRSMPHMAKDHVMGMVWSS
jgi:hypothetical protein